MLYVGFIIFFGVDEFCILFVEVIKGNGFLSFGKINVFVKCFFDNSYLLIMVLCVC